MSQISLRNSQTMKRNITFKSHPYIIFGDYIWHQGKDVPMILFEFHEGVYGNHFGKNYCNENIAKWV